jgi:hypothetical protein
MPICATVQNIHLLITLNCITGLFFLYLLFLLQSVNRYNKQNVGLYSLLDYEFTLPK